MLRLLAPGGGIRFCLRDELAPALLTGWPHAPEIKAVCFSSVRGSREVDRELAHRILLEGYSQDEDVINFYIDHFNRERSPFVGLHHDAWRLLRQYFQSQQRIVEAIDSWIVRHGEHLDDEIAHAALVGWTPTGKQKLLSSLPLLSSTGLHGRYLKAGGYRTLMWLGG